MGFSLFISDLHLCETRPEIITAFVTFLEQTAVNADALYILGDLFEYWAGDDCIEMGTHAKTIQALSSLHNHNVNTFFIHGNRDFLIGEGFSRATQIKILSDPCLVSLYGKDVLLSHGDALCTDDIAYQRFRADVRRDDWQKQFLSQPLQKRIAYIESIRLQSDKEKSIKSMQIMDVNETAVSQLFKQYGYPPLLIHGHTHRPNRHEHQIDEHHCERWVLGDWYEHGSYLQLDQKGLNAHTL